MRITKISDDKIMLSHKGNYWTAFEWKCGRIRKKRTLNMLSGSPRTKPYTVWTEAERKSWPEGESLEDWAKRMIARRYRCYEDR